MKIAIVEDEKEHALLLESYIKNWSEKRGRQVICRIFDSPEAFLFEWAQEKDFAILFLDIQMPKMSGMELAKRIRKDSDLVGIVFTTGIVDFMQEGYEVSAIHYLLKPLSEEKVVSCLEKFCQKAQTESPSLVLRTQTGTQRFYARQIWWICAMGHHILAGAEQIPSGENKAGGLRRLEASDSIGDVERVLPKDGSFVKCHRSYLVNLSHVYRIEKTEVVLDNGDKIPLSRRLYQTVNDSFIRYYQKENGE